MSTRDTRRCGSPAEIMEMGCDEMEAAAVGGVGVSAVLVPHSAGALLQRAAAQQGATRLLLP